VVGRKGVLEVDGRVGACRPGHDREQYERDDSRSEKNGDS
jgi:hypothetical protein